MIKSFAHKGLEKFFFHNDTSGIQAAHAKKLAVILDWLNAVSDPQSMNFPGSGLHHLKGNLQDRWSVKVSANWRVTFRFENGDAYLVNYVDYH